MSNRKSATHTLKNTELTIEYRNLSGANSAVHMPHTPNISAPSISGCGVPADLPSVRPINRSMPLYTRASSVL